MNTGSELIGTSPAVGSSDAVPVLPDAYTYHSVSFASSAMSEPACRGCGDAVLYGSSAFGCRRSCAPLADRASTPIAFCVVCSPMRLTLAFPFNAWNVEPVSLVVVVPVLLALFALPMRIDALSAAPAGDATAAAPAAPAAATAAVS